VIDLKAMLLSIGVAPSTLDFSKKMLDINVQNLGNGDFIRAAVERAEGCPFSVFDPARGWLFGPRAVRSGLNPVASVRAVRDLLWAPPLDRNHEAGAGGEGIQGDSR
jgi:hypothetical protein